MKSNQNQNQNPRRPVDSGEGAAGVAVDDAVHVHLRGGRERWGADNSVMLYSQAGCKAGGGGGPAAPAGARKLFSQAFDATLY